MSYVWLGRSQQPEDEPEEPDLADEEAGRVETDVWRALD